MSVFFVFLLDAISTKPETVSLFGRSPEMGGVLFGCTAKPTQQKVASKKDSPIHQRDPNASSGRTAFVSRLPLTLQSPVTYPTIWSDLLLHKTASRAR